MGTKWWTKPIVFAALFLLASISAVEMLTHSMLFRPRVLSEEDHRRHMSHPRLQGGGGGEEGGRRVQAFTFRSAASESDPGGTQEEAAAHTPLLHGMLVNTRAEAKWTDRVFLYSHGTSALAAVMAAKCSSVDFFSQFGSVFLYDYCGWGQSAGAVSEQGIYCDARGAYNYALSQGATDIVLVGHSLGCAVSTRLAQAVVSSSSSSSPPPSPSAVVLWAPFYSTDAMAEHICPGLSRIITRMMQHGNTSSVPMLILHSPDDEVIPFAQAARLAAERQCQIVTLPGGSHSRFIVNDEVKVAVDAFFAADNNA